MANRPRYSQTPHNFVAHSCKYNRLIVYPRTYQAIAARASATGRTIVAVADEVVSAGLAALASQK